MKCSFLSNAKHYERHHIHICTRTYCTCDHWKNYQCSVFLPDYTNKHADNLSCTTAVRYLCAKQLGLPITLHVCSSLDTDTELLCQGYNGMICLYNSHHILVNCFSIATNCNKTVNSILMLLYNCMYTAYAPGILIGVDVRKY